MDGDALLGLFDELVDEVIGALSDLDDWGPSGARPDQYTHDVVADTIIVQRLQAEGFAVLSEESGLMAGDGGTGVTVIVDPIDGSTNASRDLPWYATSLCAVDAEGALAATVVNLATGERFQSIRGEGAACDGQAIGPSGRVRLADAFVAFSGLPPANGGWSQFRVYGAAALDLCAVATGTFDGYVDLDRAHGVWDYAGALLVCREAGVPMVDSGGAELLVLDPGARRGPVAAATPELLEELVAMVRRWPPMR